MSFWDPNTDISSQPLKGNVGDRIAWTVVLVQPNGRKQIPYTVSFFKDGEPNSSFLGVSSLSVPSGGLSEFLTVRSLSGQISYRIDAPGYGCLLDPDIQSGDSGFTPVAKTASIYAVSWDTNTREMTCTKDGVNSPFPIIANRGDKISFTITRGSTFEIDFAVSNVPNLWASPFDQLDNVFQAKDDGIVIGPLTVLDNQDLKGTGFPFSGAATTAAGHVTSNSYEIRLG